MIRTDSLCKVYRDSDNVPVRAVDNVSCSIPAGSLVALTGPSGSGKSSLLSLLGALSRPTSGNVVINDQDLSACSDVELARLRRNIGFVFQNFSLLPRLSVWENVTYPLIPQGEVPAARFEIARHLMEQLGIPKKLESRPDQLSGGEQQRVAVARALACRPRILLADEPTSNLDIKSEAELTEVLREIHATGVTMVISTHNPGLLTQATDIIELQNGKVTCF